MTSLSKTQKCAKCKRRFNSLTLMQCRYSRKGAVICFWCCKKCPHIRRWENHWRCGYEKI